MLSSVTVIVVANRKDIVWAVRYQLIYGRAPVRSPVFGDRWCIAFEKGCSGCRFCCHFNQKITRFLAVESCTSIRSIQYCILSPLVGRFSNYFIRNPIKISRIFCSFCTGIFCAFCTGLCLPLVKNPVYNLSILVYACRAVNSWFWLRDINIQLLSHNLGPWPPCPHYLWAWCLWLWTMQERLGNRLFTFARPDKRA